MKASAIKVRLQEAAAHGLHQAALRENRETAVMARIMIEEGIARRRQASAQVSRLVDLIAGRTDASAES